jgi:WD40 repeat protein
LETSQLLETLTGHSSIITGLATFDNTLCSVSRDKTLKFWNILEGSCLETVQMLEECLDVKYRFSIFK